ncbi:MAG: phosphate ABC transporter, permease protein PstA, partial [Gammaproteobacteria bacterium]
MTGSVNNFKSWWQSGAPWIWLNAGAVSASIIIVFGLLLLIAVRGMGHFWPADIVQMDYASDTGQIRIIGEKIEYEMVEANRYEESGLGKAPAGAEHVKRWLIKTGNRELLGFDFRWIDDHRIQQQTTPDDLVIVERLEWGNFYGYL